MGKKNKQLLLQSIKPAAHKGGKISLGQEIAVPLADLSQVIVESENEGVLRLEKRSGGLLMKLIVGTKERAQSWEQQFRECMPSSPSGSDPSPAALKELVSAMERHIAQLENLNERKEEQLLTLHARLEEALEVLQLNKKTYSEQHKLVDMQASLIEQLKKKAQTVRAVIGTQASSGPVVATSTSATVSTDLLRTAASGADDDEEEEEEEDEGFDEEVMQLMQKAEGLQKMLETLQLQQTQAVTADPPLPSQAAAREFLKDDAQKQTAKAMAENLAMSAAPSLMEALSALSSEKERLEAQLKEEQGSLESQLKYLHEQMAELEELEKEQAAET